MNFLRFILIIGLFFKEHVGSVELQWDVPQNRKLLLTGGTADDASKEKVASFASAGTSYTGVSLTGIVVVPAALEEPITGKQGDGATAVTVGSIKVAEGHTFIRDAGLTDMTAGKEPASGAACKVLGVDATFKAVTIDCAVTSVAEKSFTCKSKDKMCASDIGAGVLCDGALAGILKGKAVAAAGGDAAGTTAAPAAGAEARLIRRKREGEETTAAAAAGGAGGAAGGVDCDESYDAVTITELQALITAEIGLASNIRPTYLITFIPAVIILSFIFLR